jgi:hypothetical protein
MCCRVVLLLGVLGMHATAGAQRDSALRGVRVVEADRSGCINEPALRARVARWLGRDTTLAGLEVFVEAASEPPGFTVRRAGAVVAERRFESSPPRCADRVEALALAIALALEHAADAERASQQPAGSTGEAASTASTSEVAAATTPQAVDEEKIDRGATAEAPLDSSPDVTKASGVPARARLHATGMVLAEVLPEPVIALGLGAELRLRALLLGVALMASTESEQAFASGRASSQLLAGRLRACTLWAIVGLELEGCTGAHLGAALGAGRGYDRNTRATMAWVAPLLRVGVRFPESSTVSLRVAVEGVVNLVRPRMVVDDGAEDHRVDGGAVAGSAGLEIVVAVP